MSYALEIRTEETPAPADGFAISDLWMIPILLLALMFETFSRHLVKLRQMRRTRPMPKDWQSFYPDLRTSEWAIRMVSFEGARQILLGGELDLSAISFDPEPPDNFQPPMPRSALAMHRRMEDLARFHADPERHVRRHAERIRERVHNPFGRSNPNPKNFPSRPNPAANFPVATSNVPVAIRGPPWRASFLENTARPSPQPPPARTRPYAPNLSASSTKLPT